MKKIPTVFMIDHASGLATPLVRAESNWVAAGEGTASIKMDGMATRFRDGRLWKRYDRKLNKQAARRKALGQDLGPLTENLFKQPPDGFEPCESAPDPITHHWPGWVPVHATDPADQWLREGWANTPDLQEDATYELVGPTLALNVYALSRHELWLHGAAPVEIADRSWQGLRDFLAAREIEGVVFTHPDGRRAKARRKDFGLFWVQEDMRKPQRSDSGE